MVDSDVNGGQERPEVPDFAEMRRTMERDNRRHVMDGMGCLRPSCDGILECDDVAVRCTDCEFRVRVNRDPRHQPSRRGPDGETGDGRPAVRDR